MTTVWQNTEIPRDRYERPLVIPPENEGKGLDKRVPYRRVTRFVGVLEDEYNFRQRDKRLVAFGMGQRTDLQLAASALSTDEPHKRKLQKVADAAYEAARGDAAADIGTALHGHTETHDRGIPLGFIPPPFDADLEAYKRVTEGIEWLSVECFRVHDTWKVAGTADRIGRDKHGRVRVYDVKTGQNAVDYPHGMAAQLGMYGHCQPYDIATDTRSPIEEDLDQETGVIIWLPAGKAHCELHELDIKRGWEVGCQRAKGIWDWRSEKRLIWPADDPMPSRTPTVWESTVREAASLDDLRIIWVRAHKVGTLTPRLKGMIEQRRQQIEMAS